MNTADLGQGVADAVVAQFSQIKTKAGKPTTRSNGIKEWTVLAGLVAIDLENPESLRVLSVATGVKAMPDSVRQYSSGRIVHDMHAEILCLRVFNRYLMDEVLGLCPKTLLQEISAESADSQDSRSRSRSRVDPDKKLVNDSQLQSQFQLKPSIKLALYISEPPCGDASMGHISQGQDSWTTPETGSEHVAKRQKIVRGRANFGDFGVVRTKPGRADSQISYSKSCSDKLCVKQYTGILNCICSTFISPIFLDYLVVDAAKYQVEDFNRCFTSRLIEKPPHPLQILTFAENNYDFGKAPEKVPSPLSLAHCPLTNTLDVLNMGVKNGAYVKKKPPKPSGTSTLCRQNLWVQAKSLLPHYASYRQLKIANDARQKLKHSARNHMGSWPTCLPDDEFAV